MAKTETVLGDVGRAAPPMSGHPPRPPLHLGLYGEPQVGKTDFLAVLIVSWWEATGLPSYVAFFDRQGKHLTYEKVLRRKLGAFATGEGVDKRGTPWRQYSVKGQSVLRLAFYAVVDVAQTDGPSRLMEFFPVFEREVAAGKWAGFGLDSVSFLAYDARKESQYVTNPTTSKGNKQHGLQWYGAATDVTEEVLCSLVPNLACNTVCVMHESKVTVEAEGAMVRSPAIPGKRLASTNMVAATFPELWRLYAERTEDGKKVRRLQTESDEFQAGTIIGAPDGCKPTPEAIWSGWEK